MIDRQKNPTQKAAEQYVETAYRDFCWMHKNRFHYLTSEVEHAMFFKHCLSPSMISALRREESAQAAAAWLLAVIAAVNDRIEVTR